MFDISRDMADILYIPLLITLLSFWWLWEKKIEPFISNRIAQKAMNTGELSKFKTLGFRITEDRLYGEHKNYVIIIARYWHIQPSNKSSSIAIYIFYKRLPSLVAKYFEQNFHFKFNKKYNGWLNEFQYYIRFRVKPPKFETILSEINLMIENDLKPISEKDSDEVYDKYAEHFI